MCRRFLLALAATAICLPAGAAKPKKKSVQALLSQYETYYGQKLVDPVPAAGSNLLNIPDYADIFTREYPDFAAHNTTEAERLTSAEQQIEISARPLTELVATCDSLLANNNVQSPSRSNTLRSVTTTISITGTSADGRRVTLYGDKKNDLVAILENAPETGGSAVVGDFEEVDFPYYTLPYKPQAEAFAKANIALRTVSTRRDALVAEIRKAEKLAEQQREADAAAAAALLERQIKNFKPDAAIAAANKFLASKGHSVSRPQKITNNGVKQIEVFSDDFSRFTSGLKAAETKLPQLRRTVAQIADSHRYTAQNKSVLTNNVRTLLSQNEQTAHSYRKAMSEKSRRSIFEVTYTAGLVGKVTLYVNPDQTINYLQWRDSSGKVHTEYPTLEATMKAYGEIADAVDTFRKYLNGK